MTIENGPISESGGSALARAKFVSQALADAARRARVSRRGRAYVAGGFHARRGQSVVRIALVAGFWLLVAAPSLAAFVYYGVIASNQYETEAEFTVTGGNVPIIDSIGAMTGLPSLSIVQDTQIVVNYITSRAALERLDADLGLRSLFSSPDIDWLSRFNPKKPIEKFVRYWESMIDVSIKMPAGIVVVKTRAFDPDDAARIGGAVLDECERLVNVMNERMRRDAVASAEGELNRTSARLAQARVALEKARNDDGLLDTEKTADALGKLLGESRMAQMRLQQDYTTQLRSVSPEAPQMQALKSRLEATAGQINEIEAKLTTTKYSDASRPVLASYMTKYAELDLERQIAERLYAAAAVSLEVARVTAEHKAMYLNTFVKPTAPQEPRYPRRLLYPTMIMLGCLLVWGVLCVLVNAIRNNMA